MTETWDEELAELRALYLREAGARLAALDGWLDTLERDATDARALAEVRRAFHSFSGSGSTYGLPRVSALGLEAERRCTSVGSGPAVADDLRAWRGWVASLRDEIDGAAAPAASASAPSTSEIPAASTEEPAAPPAAGVSVLVIESEAGDRPALVRGLELDGFAVTAATSLAQARAALAGRLPDAVIVDVGPDEASGFALIESLRARPGGDKPVVLVVSPHGGVLDRVEAIHCGADGHFTRPVDVAAVVRRLRFLLDRERAEPPRILSVEDDRHQEAFLRTVLSAAGYEFRAVGEPARLEAELAAFRPDLVLMDVMLPGVSGYDLVRSLRQDERYTTVPVIILTTRGEMDARIEAAQAGGDEHLVKPVSPALLLSTVAARVERGRFLRTLVERDGLTGLLTHTALLERARACVARKRRDARRQWTWIMIDLDRFKGVNDRYGHPTGDLVLARLAGLLRARLRQADVVGRYGGEEFAVVLEDLHGDDAVRLVERLRADFAAIEHRPREGGEPFHVTLSAGLATLAEGEDLSAWVQAADEALYEAKAAGRDRVVVAPARG